MTAQEFVSRLHGVKRLGDEYTGQCPSHDDQRNSLSVKDGDKGVVLKCFAGCTVDDITAALGVSVSDLFAENGNGHRPAPPPPFVVVARYPYHDEHGTLLYEVERRQPKDFRPRQPDGHGGWIPSLTKPEVRRVLYRLPHLIGKGTAYLVEGEADADRLAAFGLPATTSHGGAKSWRDAYGDQLTAAGITKVVILPDHDLPGDEYAVNAATSCLNRGLLVKLVRLPGLSDHGDVSDWLNAGHTLSELSNLIRETPLATRETLMAPLVPPAHELLFTQDGDGYRCEWPQDCVGLSLTHLIETSSGLHAEATVYRLSSTGEWSHRLQWTTVNLSSSTARAGLAKILSSREHGKGVDWVTLLDAAGVATAEALRAPTPTVDLATLEPSTHDQFAIAPLVTLHETSILYGDGDSGKSYLSIALGMAVSGGPQVASILPPSIQTLLHGPVLYLDYESSANKLTTRLHALALGGDVWPLPSIQYRAMHRPLAEDIGNVKAEIQRLGVCLVILDSMAPACGGKPEDSETVIRFMNVLRSLGPVSRLMICHTPKSDREKLHASIFGSAFTRNLSRCCWEVRGEKQENILTVGLFRDKGNDGPPQKPIGITMTWAGARCTLTPSDIIDSPTLSQSASVYDRILDALKTGARTIADLSQYVNVPHHDLKKRLPTMRTVRRVGDGTGMGERWGLATRDDHHTAHGGMYDE